ncbi:hypothetical protein E2542_SST31291 [Spatholobus suberectus]|nr:hypothetical protein E2542_SST31291 [Spatholobus suberectus]
MTTLICDLMLRCINWLRYVLVALQLLQCSSCIIEFLRTMRRSITAAAFDEEDLCRVDAVVLGDFAAGGMPQNEELRREGAS